MTTGEAAQFRNFWYEASPRPIAKTMIIKNTANHPTKTLLSSRMTNMKYVRFFSHQSLDTGCR
jgi:hypothetical protein